MTADPRDFRFHCELEAFVKADAPEGTGMRIGGIASTEALDADKERLVQEGLDFSEFLKAGWFNDNHGRKATDVVGYPTDAKLVRPGQKLPNGKTAKKKGWWVEGYLLNTPKGAELWKLTQALQDTPRRLGFSVEGAVTKRDDKDENKVVRAKVRNVAVTHCPKNSETEMEALAKAMSAGYPSSATFESRSGGDPGDGAPLARQALDRKHRSAEAQDLEDLADPVEVDLDAWHDSDDEVAKAQEIDAPEFVGAPDYLSGWGSSLAQAVHETVRESSAVGMDAARSFVRAQRPDLGDDEIETIIAHARSQPWA